MIDFTSFSNQIKPLTSDYFQVGAATAGSNGSKIFSN